MDRETLSIVSAIALNSVFGYEPKYSHNIIDALGSTEAIFALSPQERADLFGPYTRLAARLDKASLEHAHQEYERLKSQGYSFVSICDKAYPELLRDCPDAPILLYVRSGSSAESLFDGRPFISIVGTRDLSPYGKEWCERIVQSLASAELKPCIVSGLALGVDICAHMSALACGLPTIGVSPVGIDDVYPRRHSVAAEKICRSACSGLITDYPPGTAPLAHTFLRRNRIIAGMSSATILIESKIKGGGAMTARLASGYGREVFVLPGRIDDLRSGACNALLAEKLAEPIVDLSQLPSKLGLGQGTRQQRDYTSMVLHALKDADAQRRSEALSLVEIIGSHRGIGPEELCARTGLSYPRVSELLTRLESAAIISVDLLQNCSLRRL